MSPEQIITNLTNIVGLVLTALGPLALGVGTLAYVGGKAADNPRFVSWGYKGWLGGGVALAAKVVEAVIRNLAGRVGGG
jgi:hypothetical protein